MNPRQVFDHSLTVIGCAALAGLLATVGSTLLRRLDMDDDAILSSLDTNKRAVSVDGGVATLTGTGVA